MKSSIDELLEEDTFRNNFGLSTEKGGRRWLYPKIIRGKLYKLREYIAFFLIAVLLIGPFLEWKGHPLFLFNILERKFILFGTAFWPQDFHLLAIGLLTFMVFIVLFTVVFGRVWCGWACPQTLFMEMIFRKIENWIEGDFNKQKAFDESPLTFQKIIKKTLKHLLFFSVSFLIANIFLMYLIGKNEVFKLISEGPLVHWGKLASLLIFTTVFYWVFAKFRELVCILVCPYGRLQGVLLDRNSIAVTYDYKRGEPRKQKSGQNNNQPTGDCIDCKICVHVCPTGIDIRNGIQLECVNCTACIDACDLVMTKIKKPTRLIKFASINTIEQNQNLKFTKRIAAYSTLLLALVSLMSFLLLTRKDIETSIFRTPGTLFQKISNGNITNIYNFEMVNKTFENQIIAIRPHKKEVSIKVIGKENGIINLDKEAVFKGSLLIEVPNHALDGHKNIIEIDIWQNDKIIETIKTNFLAP